MAKSLPKSEKAFLTSLKRYSKKRHGYDDFFTNSIDDTLELYGDGIPMIAEKAMLASVIDEYTRQLTELLSLCGSPIEETMLYALIIVAQDNWPTVRFVREGYMYGDYNNGPETITIEPQAHIDNYRVDFLLSGESYAPKYNSLKERIVVECDGHDFHEKTKAQAKKDKKRDRDLQKLGYVVLRYTGSEVWNGALSCAYEAVSILRDKIYNNRGKNCPIKA